MKAPISFTGGHIFLHEYWNEAQRPNPALIAQTTRSSFQENI